MLQPAALNRKDAATYLALKLSTFEGLVRSGSIPSPRQLADRRVAWLRAELDAWLLARPISKQLPPPNTGAAKPRSPQVSEKVF
jgi:prophage regulatory protein